MKAFVEMHEAAMAASASLPHLAHHAQAVYTVAEGGPVDLLAELFENVLKVLDQGLETAGVPYAYGFSIIALTCLVKLATFPLSQKQVESTLSLQALQPRVKELQAKHANDTETLQLETARLYKDAGVNPLAGCLPTLATIPVFIGLYQALTRAANDGLLVDSFLWIPSLGGPVSLGDQKDGAGLAWLFPLVDGHPPIGWGPALAYLTMPVLLVVSQFVSQKIISGQSAANTDPSQAQAQAILKFLPLMIGWFALNVPSGLTLYWFTNNVLSTAQQLYLKSNTKINVPSDASASTSVISSTTPIVKPKEERIKSISGKDVNARKKKTRRNDNGEEVEDVEVEVMSSSSSNGSSLGSSGSSSSNSRGKGDKFRALKAREAASIAKEQATVGSASGSQQGPPSSSA